MSRLLEIAELLIPRGVPISPVRPGTKRAFLPQWPATATTDLETIKTWDAAYPDHNAAAVALAIEGGTWFLELDNVDVVAQIKAETGHDMKEIQTFKVRSRPGRAHYYFRHNAASLSLGNIPQTHGEWSARLNNEYVVAPKSVHPDTGKEYEAMNDNPIIEAPQWLIDWLIAQKSKPVVPMANTATPSPSTVTPGSVPWKSAEQKLAEIPRENGLMIHGSYHGALLILAGYLRSQGLEADEIEPLLIEYAENNFTPPIEWDKVTTMAKSICTSFPAGTPGKALKMSTRFGESTGSNFMEIIPVEQRAAVLERQNKGAETALDNWLNQTEENPVEYNQDQIVKYVTMLAPLSYETRRKLIAEKSGLRATFLDDQYKKTAAASAATAQVNDVAVLIVDNEAWGEPVDLVSLLNETESVFREYIHFKRAEDSATCALWVGQTYTAEYQSEFPYLGVRSPVEGCGKSSVLDLIAGMSFRSLKAGNTSAAAAFRILDKFHPCLIIDEADTFINTHDEFIGILNSGHTKDGGHIFRVLGEDHNDITPFAVWGPKAYGMIGTAPATFASRSIPVILERAVKADGLTQFPKTPRGKDALKLRLTVIARKWRRWVDDNKDAIANWEPDVSAFENRMADNWYPLIRIAEMAGSEWTRKALKAAHAVDPYAKADDMRLLLRDIQNIFHTREEDVTTPGTLVSDLMAQPTGWDEMGKFDKPITGKKLSDMLERFGIRSHKSDGARVYRLEDFKAVFERFLTDPPRETELGSKKEGTGKAGGGLKMDTGDGDEPVPEKVGIHVVTGKAKAS